MKWIAVFAFAAMRAIAADAVSHSTWGGILTVECDDSTATEIEWLSSTAVRVGLGRGPQRLGATVAFATTETPEALVMEGRNLTVQIRKKPFAIHFISGSEKVEFQWRGGVAEYAIAPGERFYGLGARDGNLNLARTSVKTDRPFLLSSRLHGVYFPHPGEYEFDAGRTMPGVLRVKGGIPDFHFYSAGELKGVLEEHHAHLKREFDYSRADVSVPLEVKPDYAFSLPNGSTALPILNGSMAGLLIPAVSINHPLAPLMPVVLKSSEAELKGKDRELRSSLETHFLTYIQEARDRGMPVVHPLPLQFPHDPKAAAISDEFMLGDELLVAMAEEVYLPQGFWTNLSDGRQFRGRQTIKGTLGSPFTVFARNGTIVPRDRSFGMELHYFPKLGGEYFIVEPELGLMTQVHAGPALDTLRLEIDEKAGRDYEWVVYHVAKPASVMLGTQQEPPASWSYDEKNLRLRIRVRAEAGDNIVISVTFARDDWYFAP